MTVRCPVCDAETAEDAGECAVCGKVLAPALELIDEELRLEGLEATRLEADTAAPVERLGELEPTQVARPDLPVPELAAAALDIEATRLEADPSAPGNWTGGLDVDRGREDPDPERTADPADLGRCPWCGAETREAVCGQCGRRRSRYTAARDEAPLASAAGDEGVLCPACFARVPGGTRCEECGVPFPLREL